MKKKLDVLLINSPSPNPGAIISHRMFGFPPLGIGYIATVLNTYGYNSKILDFLINTVSLRDLKKYFEEYSIKIVGISTTTETYKTGVKIAQIVKTISPDTSVVMGGSHVTFEYNNEGSYKYVDYIIRGEGERTFLELCNLIIKGKGNIEDIDGIVFLDGNTIRVNKDREFIDNLDSLPFPDRSLYQMNEYYYPATISTSRGCPGKCIFCAASALSGGKYRVRSAENVVDEVKYLRHLGYKEIQFIDDTMTADVRRLNKIIDLILESNLDIRWWAESRVDIINKELLLKMYASGCRTLQFGVEAGNQQMLDCLKKNITLNQVRRVFNWCIEIGIEPVSCLIIGQPYDNENTIKDTIDIGRELSKLGARIFFSISTPYPGTYMYNHSSELGIKILNMDTDVYTTQTAVYDSKYLTAREIQNYFFDACLDVGRFASKDQELRDKEMFEEIMEFNKKIV